MRKKAENKMMPVPVENKADGQTMRRGPEPEEDHPMRGAGLGHEADPEAPRGHEARKRAAG